MKPSRLPKPIRYQNAIHERTDIAGKWTCGHCPVRRHTTDSTAPAESICNALAMNALCGFGSSRPITEPIAHDIVPNSTSPTAPISSAPAVPWMDAIALGPASIASPTSPIARPSHSFGSGARPPGRRLATATIQIGVVATIMLDTPLARRCEQYAMMPLPMTSNNTPPTTPPVQCSRAGAGVPLTRRTVYSTAPPIAWRAAIIGHGGMVSVPIFIARYVLPQIT